MERSPELSNARNDLPLTGDEPVLKGVNSSIVLERRNAYLAGNLRGLLAEMTPEQLLALKQWAVRVALRKLHYTMNHSASRDAVREAALEISNLIKQWLEAPNDKSRRVVENASFDLMQVVNGLVNEEYVGGSMSLTLSAARLLLTALTIPSDDGHFIGWIRWSISCAPRRWNSELDAASSAAAHVDYVGRAYLRAAYIILKRGDRT